MLALTMLEAVVSDLGPRDQSFALDLITKGKKYGLSEKQLYWVNVLLKKVTDPKVEVPAEKVDVSGIISLLTKAGERLKHPKVRLITESGLKVVLKIAGERSKYNGSVMVTDGGPFGANVYYGRISPEGDFVSSSKITDEVTTILKMFAADPAGTGAMIGKKFGHCCFCSRQLDTKESLAVGYGPVCADKYSLPWG